MFNTCIKTNMIQAVLTVICSLLLSYLLLIIIEVTIKVALDFQGPLTVLWPYVVCLCSHWRAPALGAGQGTGRQGCEEHFLFPLYVLFI